MKNLKAERNPSPFCMLPILANQFTICGRCGILAVADLRFRGCDALKVQIHILTFKALKFYLEIKISNYLLGFKGI